MSTKALIIPKSYTPTGLALPATLSFDDWLSIGATLQKAGAAVQWWLGDWWCFGDAKYGERAAQAMDPDFPWSLQTCMNCASVARRVETYRRREVLPFSHHAEVASLAPAQQDELLDRAATNNWTRAELRGAVRDLKRMESVEEQFARWAAGVKTRFEHAKANLDLLRRIESNKVKLTGFENGRPVVVDRGARTHAALSADPHEGKELRAWLWRKLDRSAKGGGWSVMRSADETAKAAKAALEKQLGVEVEVRGVR
jgi:hypothetical protein